MTTKPLVHRKFEKRDGHYNLQFPGFVDAFEFLKNHPAFQGRFQGVLIKDIHWETLPKGRDGFEARIFKIHVGVVCSDDEIPCDPKLEVLTFDPYKAVMIPAELVRRRHGDYRKTEKKGE